MGIWLGILSFALFFLGDWNDWKHHWPLLRVCFPAAVVLLAVSTVLLAEPGRVSGAAALWAAAAVFGGLLVYTLFFALPAGSSYVSQEQRRPACVSGVYALCRHPGVLWFAGEYLCLWRAAGLPAAAVALYIGLDVLLVWFEDAKVFPASLSGYEEYRRVTPFLIPSGRSIRAACTGFACR